MIRLDRTEIVVTVGAISLGSPSHRTMARLTPSSLKLSTASIATIETANAPNSRGPSRRASATPIPIVLSLATTLLRKLQPRAFEALPTRVPLSASESFTSRYRRLGLRPLQRDLPICGRQAGGAHDRRDDEILLLLSKV